MNPASLQGLMDNRKTQTRRLLWPPPEMVEHGHTVPWQGEPDALLRLLRQAGRKCPYGQPGDFLWVRETWRPLCRCGLDGALIQYQAGGAICQAPFWPGAKDLGPWWKTCLDPWRPSIFMPRQASRILLEVEQVRLEPLQAISFDDCMAEGIISTPFWGGDVDFKAIEAYPQRPKFIPPTPNYQDDGIDQGWMDYARGVYAKLWDSINAGRGHPWDSNPWVWAVTFHVLEFRGKPEPEFYVEEVRFDQPAEGQAN
jgi:hypothetical protein